MLVLACAPAPGLDAGSVMDGAQVDGGGLDAGASMDSATCSGIPPSGPICEREGPQTAAWCANYSYPGACSLCASPCVGCAARWTTLADPCGTPPCWLMPYPCTDAAVDAGCAEPAPGTVCDGLCQSFSCGDPMCTPRCGSTCYACAGGSWSPVVTDCFCPDTGNADAG